MESIYNSDFFLHACATFSDLPSQSNMVGIGSIIRRKKIGSRSWGTYGFEILDLVIRSVNLM